MENIECFKVESGKSIQLRTCPPAGTHGGVRSLDVDAVVTSEVVDSVRSEHFCKSFEQ